MKIGILSYSFLPRMGGYQIFIYNLISRLQNRGHDVDLYVPRNTFRKFKKLNWPHGFRVRPIFWKENFLTIHLPILIEALILLYQKQNRYDIWQIFGAFPSGSITRLISKITPTVIRSYGQDIQASQELGYGYRLDPKIEKRISKVIRNVTRLVALTDEVKDRYLELGADPDKIVNIPNGIDLKRFLIRVDILDIRETLGIIKNEKFILTVGRYHKKKGYEYIPFAAKELEKQGLSFKWCLIGKGIKEHIWEDIKQLKLEKHVFCIDEIGSHYNAQNNRLPEVPSDSLINIYKAADLFVFPSLMETFGMVLIEAMAAGLPVVTTNAPGCRDIVMHEVNGLLAEPRDSESLAANIMRIFDNNELKKSILESIEESISQYDWENIVNQFEKLYMGICLK